MEPDPQDSAPRRVEAYLDTVLASLPRRLSAFERKELRRELRTHLWERVAAYEELGQTENDAVTEALQQFGGGKDFVKQWRREWRKPIDRLTLREVWEAGKSAFDYTILTLMLAYTPILICLSLFPLDRHWLPFWRPWIDGHPTQLCSTLCWFELVGLPIALGLAVGRRTPKKPGWRVFLSLTAQVMIGIIGAGVSRWSQIDKVSDLLIQVALLEVVWLPLACTAAALSGWWTRRAEERGTRPLRLD